MKIVAAPATGCLRVLLHPNTPKYTLYPAKYSTEHPNTEVAARTGCGRQAVRNSATHICLCYPGKTGIRELCEEFHSEATSCPFLPLTFVTVRREYAPGHRGRPNTQHVKLAVCSICLIGNQLRITCDVMEFFKKDTNKNDK